MIAKTGVVIATDKKLPTILVDESSHRKISPLTSSGGIQLLKRILNSYLILVYRCGV